jgi:hypothetical protein
MNILDIIPVSDRSFILQIAKPTYVNKQQIINTADPTRAGARRVPHNRNWIPYPYFKEDMNINLHKDVYVIPYIEKYFHNMMEFFTNILYLKKHKKDFMLVVVCDKQDDWNPQTRLPYGWEDSDEANRSHSFKQLLDFEKINYVCFPSTSKDFLEMVPKSGYFFYDNIDNLFYENLTRAYPKKMYLRSHVPHEPCITHTKESMETRVDLLLEWAPKYNTKNRKVYIARKNFGDRILKNEDSLIEYMTSIGYETIYFENHSVLEQIKIVQESSHIVVQSGSSLFNCLFANQNTYIYEIESHKYDVGIYRLTFEKYNIPWKKVRMAIPDGNYIVNKIKEDSYFQDAFVAQRTEQDSSKVLVAGSTPAEGASDIIGKEV